MIGTDRWRSEPACVYPPAKAGQMPNFNFNSRPNGKGGYSTRRHMLEPVRPGSVLPDRALS